MRLLGIELRRPGFWEFTSTSVMAVGLWLLLSGIASRVDPGMTRADFASLLAVMWLSVLGVRMGLDPRASWAAAVVHGVAWIAVTLLLQVLI